MSASQAGRRGFEPRLPLKTQMLSVRIYSFSYKMSGIPHDETSNGGGFVFDCRFIHNPGREANFKTLTGKNKQVIEYLHNDKKIQAFLENVYAIVDEAVENYLIRDFTDLMVSFGCTGGQHRSVYAAERLKTHLINKFDAKINITVTHTEFPELSSN